MPVPISVASPTPDPFAATRVNQQIRSITDRVPGVRRLPADVRPFVLNGLDLLLLCFVFLLIRRLLGGLVRNWTNNVAEREEKAGNRSRAARLRTLTGLTTSIVVYAVAILFLFTALGIVGFNMTGVVGTAGVAGIAFGFGAQKVAKDVITGFIILFEDQYAVGEYVTINGVTGTVEDLAVRTTEIRDDDGKLYILSNGDIAQVCNQSRGPVAGSFEINIAAGADVDEAIRILNDALGKASGDLHLEAGAHIAGIAGVDAAKTTLKVSYRAGGSVRPGPVALHLRETARSALITAGIPIG